ncbi:MAG: outer membrane beta-barrel protein [Rhizobiaceae bacterium]
MLSSVAVAQDNTDPDGGEERGLNQSLLDRLSLAARRTTLDSATRPEEPEEKGFQAPEYEPVSEGAETGDEERSRRNGEAVSIFDLNRDNPFARDRSSGERPVRRQRRSAGGDERALTTRDRIEAERSGESATRPDEEAITGTVPAERVDALDEERNTAADPSGEPTGAIEGLDREAEDDPYAALGIRAGSFLLYPELEQGLSWSSNADSSAGGGEAVLSETTLRLNAESDWSRHAARIAAFGTFRKSVSGADVSEPSGGVEADLRLDLVNGFTAIAGVEYRVAPETAASAVVIPGTVEQPLLHTLSGSLGIARGEGKLRLAATGNVERLIYGDADLGGGMVLSQRERNSTLATLTLRTGYEVSPAIVPFVEAEIGRRVYDMRLDTAGYARSADRYGVRAGVELDLGDKLTGEIAAGWVREKPDDDRLAAIEGLSALAALSWSPMRGTTVSLDASTTIETTTQPGASGSILYDASLGVERRIRANLTGNLTAGLGYRDFSGTGDRDVLFDVEAGLTWWLNRNFGITGRARHEFIDSNVAGRDSETTSVFLGVRLRR